MEYILFTDLHLGIHGNNSVWLEKSLELAKEIAKTAHRRKIKKLIFMGDFFNDRRSLNTRTIDFAHKFIEELKDFKLYMIIGNHDTYFKNTNDVNSLTMFNQYEHVKIVNKEYVLGNVMLLPWGEPINTLGHDILIGHFEINGYILNAPKIHDAYEAKDFENFNLVLSGHYHTPTKLGNIQYIGSCMPFSFSDVNSPRGYYILESTNKELEFFEFKEAPKYVIINSTDEVKEEHIKGNIVKIIFHDELGSNEEEKIISVIQTYEPLMLHTEFKLKNDEETLRQEEKITGVIPQNIQLFHDYIERLDIPVNLNKNLLKGVVSSFFN